MGTTYRAANVKNIRLIISPVDNLPPSLPREGGDGFFATKFQNTILENVTVVTHKLIPNFLISNYLNIAFFACSIRQSIINHCSFYGTNSREFRQ
jgi:hypothetical protein